MSIEVFSHPRCLGRPKRGQAASEALPTLQLLAVFCSPNTAATRTSASRPPSLRCTITTGWNLRIAEAPCVSPAAQGTHAHLGILPYDKQYLRLACAGNKQLHIFPFSSRVDAGMAHYGHLQSTRPLAMRRDPGLELLAYQAPPSIPTQLFAKACPLRPSVASAAWASPRPPGSMPGFPEEQSMSSCWVPGRRKRSPGHEASRNSAWDRSPDGSTD